MGWPGSAKQVPGSSRVLPGLTQICDHRWSGSAGQVPTGLQVPVCHGSSQVPTGKPAGTCTLHNHIPNHIRLDISDYNTIQRSLILQVYWSISMTSAVGVLWRPLALPFPLQHFSWKILTILSTGTMSSCSIHVPKTVADLTDLSERLCLNFETVRPPHKKASSTSVDVARVIRC